MKRNEPRHSSTGSGRHRKGRAKHSKLTQNQRKYGSTGKGKSWFAKKATSEQRPQNKPGHESVRTARYLLHGQLPEVSVVIRCKDGQQYLDLLIKVLREQETDFSFEILAGDENSKDRTPQILRSWGVRTAYIPRQEFFFSKMLYQADGNFVVFISQDVVPQSKDWLRTLVKPLSMGLSRGVVGKVVLGNQANSYDHYLLFDVQPPLELRSCRMSSDQVIRYASLLGPGTIGIVKPDAAKTEEPGWNFEDWLKTHSETEYLLFVADAKSLKQGSFTESLLQQKYKIPPLSRFPMFLKQVVGRTFHDWYRIYSCPILTKEQRLDAYWIAVQVAVQSR